jgi:hypothetical protein
MRRPTKLGYFAPAALVVGGAVLSSQFAPAWWGGASLAVGCVLFVAIDRAWSRIRGPVFPPPLARPARVYVAVLASVMVLTLVSVLALGRNGGLWLGITLAALSAGTVLAGSVVGPTEHENQAPEHVFRD